MARIPSSMDRTKQYMCTGENFNRYTKIGDVGDVKPLNEWLTHFYDESEEKLAERFDNRWTNEKIVGYLYNFLGKRLEVV